MSTSALTFQYNRPIVENCAKIIYFNICTLSKDHEVFEGIPTLRQTEPLHILQSRPDSCYPSFNWIQIAETQGAIR